MDAFKFRAMDGVVTLRYPDPSVIRPSSIRTEGPKSLKKIGIHFRVYTGAINVFQDGDRRLHLQVIDLK